MLRMSKGIKQSDIADVAGINHTAVSLIESGRRAASIEVLCTFADYFNVQLDFLVGRAKYLMKGVPEMDLKDIVEICETSNMEKVNRYVNAGWQLLEITSTIGGGGYPVDGCFHYCLGWNVAKGVVVHPEPPPEPTKQKPDIEPLDDDDFPF